MWTCLCVPVEYVCKSCTAGRPPDFLWGSLLELLISKCPGYWICFQVVRNIPRGVWSSAVLAAESWGECPCPSESRAGHAPGEGRSRAKCPGQLHMQSRQSRVQAPRNLCCQLFHGMVRVRVLMASSKLRARKCSCHSSSARWTTGGQFSGWAVPTDPGVATCSERNLPVSSSFREAPALWMAMKVLAQV